MVKRVVGALVGVAMVAEGMRVSKHGSSGSGKTLAGVPVLNYQTAYHGKARTSAAEKEHWIVFAKKGVETKTLEDLCKSSGACERTGHPSQGGVPFFEVYTTEEGLEKVLLEAAGAIDFVEPDGIFRLDDPEPEVEAQSSASWGLDTVGVDDAQFTGEGTHIYVFDTGIRFTHDDFSGRALPGVDYTTAAEEEVCNGNDFECAIDRQGHGTHCAGTAGGDTYGVAPKTTLYAIKTLSDAGDGQWSWTMDGLDWVAVNGESPRVASLSLGGRGVLDSFVTTVDAAVAAGVVVSVAGGNSRADACGFSPAFVPSAITVGSTDRRNRRSGFSNFGSCTDIWAPGSAIVSAGVASDSAQRTLDGTSMACPHVSGGAALLFQEDPGRSPADVLATMLSKAAEGYLTNLMDDDVNLLLWVGEGDAAPPESSCRRRLLCLGR